MLPAAVLDLAGRQRVSGHEQFWEDVLDVPPEAFAAELLPQSLPVADVTELTEVVVHPVVIICIYSIFDFFFLYPSQINTLSFSKMVDQFHLTAF